MPGRVFTQVLELAQAQHGYVRPDDLRAIDIDPKRLVDYEARGAAERVGHGIYRLRLVPPGDADEYMLAALWPAGRGVLSHETALDLHELCDVNPDRIHLTVPRAYRVTRKVPGRYRIHREHLPAGDVERRDGLPIVTPKRAIIGAIDDGLRAGLIEQAITTARDRALIRGTDADDCVQLLHARSTDE